MFPQWDSIEPLNPIGLKKPFRSHWLFTDQCIQMCFESTDKLRISLNAATHSDCVCVYFMPIFKHLGDVAHLAISICCIACLLGPVCAEKKGRRGSEQEHCACIACLQRQIVPYHNSL